MGTGDDNDGRREVHSNTYEGAGARFRTYLRGFRGVHKQYLHLYIATYEAMLNTKRIILMLVQRMCVLNHSVYAGYTRAKTL
jgi:transposase-like protein